MKSLVRNFTGFGKAFALLPAVLPVAFSPAIFSMAMWQVWIADRKDRGLDGGVPAHASPTKDVSRLKNLE